MVANSQVRMISWAWGRRSMGKTRANRSGSSSHPPAICGVSDEVAQVSITSGSPDESARLPALGSVYPSGTSVEGSTGSRSSSAKIGRSKSDLAGLVDRVPDREGHAEEPLAADVPVGVEPLHPGPVAVGHVGRVPAQLLAPGQQPVAQGQGPDEPLAGGDDLEGPVALLVELDRVGDRAGLADQVARCGQQLDDAGLGLLDRAAGQLARSGPAPPRGRRSPTRSSPRPPAAAGRRARRWSGWAGRARATTPRRWCRRRCRSWRCPSPSPGRPAGGRAPAPGRRTAG